jgi:pyridoxamine 5'-phosphate oxidase
VATAPGSDAPLDERDLDVDPVAQFSLRLSQARDAGVTFPEAMTLATADACGRPSPPTVRLRGGDERGFVLLTNNDSRTGTELAGYPNAALTFFWKELERQVCVTGTVARASVEESEVYFRTRPREARLGAWTSKQSRAVGSRDELEAAFREMEARFPGDDIPLPPHWGGFRLTPEAIEFWKGRAHRLHDRFRYTRRDNAGWDRVRLWP